MRMLEVLAIAVAFYMIGFIWRWWLALGGRLDHADELARLQVAQVTRQVEKIHEQRNGSI